MNNQTTYSTLQINLINLSQTAAGFSASEITGFSPEQVRRTAEALVKDGQMIRSKVSPRRVRYFANDQLAKDYASGRPVVAGPMLAGGARAKARWSASEPGLITSRTKVYVAPPLPRDVFRTNTYAQF